jgi:hypothetical protein
MEQHLKNKDTFTWKMKPAVSKLILYQHSYAGCGSILWPMYASNSYIQNCINNKAQPYELYSKFPLRQDYRHRRLQPKAIDVFKSYECILNIDVSKAMNTSWTCQIKYREANKCFLALWLHEPHPIEFLFSFFLTTMFRKYKIQFLWKK